MTTGMCGTISAASCSGPDGSVGASPVISRIDTSTISFDPDYKRPYTDEYTASMDHELLPSLRLSVPGVVVLLLAV